MNSCCCNDTITVNRVVAAPGAGSVVIYTNEQIPPGFCFKLRFLNCSLINDGVGLLEIDDGSHVWQCRSDCSATRIRYDSLVDLVNRGTKCGCVCIRCHASTLADEPKVVVFHRKLKASTFTPFP